MEWGGGGRREKNGANVKIFFFMRWTLFSFKGSSVSTYDKNKQGWKFEPGPIGKMERTYSKVEGSI